MTSKEQWLNNIFSVYCNDKRPGALCRALEMAYSQGYAQGYADHRKDAIRLKEAIENEAGLHDEVC